MNKTEEIDLIVNHPKKAINKLALPIIISNLFMTLNNIIDGIWVAGLGPDPLAAVGFVTPLFFAFVGVANGLGAGANSLIARCIGAEKYHDAGNSAIHAIMLCFLVTAFSTVLILIIIKPLLLIMGAVDVIDYALAYGYIVLGGVFSLFIPAMLSAIFRSQGEIERASYPLMITAILNMIFDPIFIYVLGWGITGAAFAIAVAAYTATWRLIAIGFSPLIGIGVAALTVGGAAYGARNYENLKTALHYGVKLGLISSVVICSIFFIFAEPLSFIFSYSASSAVLSERVVEALHILCFFILLMPFGILAGNIFQAMGKGTMSLILTVLRSFILEVLFAGLFAFVFNLADIGIYMGIVCGMSIGSVFGFIYVNYYLKKHRSYFK